MSLASTSRVSLQYKAETTFGSINTTTGAGTKYRDLRISGESLNYDLTKTESNEINSTRSILAQTITDSSANGGFNGDLVHGEYDLFMQSTLQSTFSQFGTNGSGGPFTCGTNTTTTLVGAATFTGAGALLKGQWLRITSAGANNGKLVRISTSASVPTTSLITLDAGTPITATTGEAITIQASLLTNGSTQTSWSIGRNANDTSPIEYMSYLGMTPNKLSLNVASGSLTTISFDFMGKSASRGTPGTNPLLASSNTLVASQAGLVHSTTNTTNCVVWAGGSPITGTYVKSIALDYDNALRYQGAVCNLGAVGIGSGTINCMVKMQIYFAEGAKFFTEFVANTAQEIVFSSVDGNGNCYVFTMPAANLQSYKVNAGGKDADLLVDVEFNALRDNTLASTASAYQKVLTVDRCGTAVDLS